MYFIALRSDGIIVFICVIIVEDIERSVDCKIVTASVICRKPNALFSCLQYNVVGPFQHLQANRKQITHSAFGILQITPAEVVT